MPSILTRQPFKALYTLLATTFESIRLPLYVVLYILPSTRPHPKWTYKQAILTKLFKTFLHHAAKVEIRVPLSLNPGKEGERFAIIRAPDISTQEKLYIGPMRDPHGEIAPEAVGGTWYPSAYPRSNTHIRDTETVVLHFHGGAYVVGSGRDDDCGFLASTFIRHAGVNRVFCPQYRLSGPPVNGRFPAALQDALTSYLYLIRDLGIPAKQIIVSGDSAGGNLVIALLRYLAEYGSEIGLEGQSPGAAWLWSPWVNPGAAIDPKAIETNPKYPTDYLPGSFGAWGIRCFAGHDEASGRQKVDAGDNYISPLGKPFKTDVPIWVQTGEAEVLCMEDCKFAEEMRKENDGHVGLWVEEGAVHDIALIGPRAGFGEEAEACARRAGEWLAENRRS
ncbi:hypothetical protein H2201_002560 [Coniosporium apollinis]|uniref:Alpha/beta hydrolase fold-3 domain-containing protein n=1 Tax=Coniosporium apollinis TaxID=61459 RepID=A0ABQ9NYA0_9PEZI|nr:hypothetical protein H2201_002560 [Coniosporium apollinis]